MKTRISKYIATRSSAFVESLECTLHIGMEGCFFSQLLVLYTWHIDVAIALVIVALSPTTIKNRTIYKTACFVYM